MHDMCACANTHSLYYYNNYYRITEIIMIITMTCINYCNNNNIIHATIHYLV